MKLMIRMIPRHFGHAPLNSEGLFRPPIKHFLLNHGQVTLSGRYYSTGQVRGSTFPDQVEDRLRSSGSTGPSFSSIPSNFYQLPGCRGPLPLWFLSVFPGKHYCSNHNTVLPPSAGLPPGRDVGTHVGQPQEHLEDLVPEDRLQRFQVQRRSDLEPAPPVEASVRHLPRIPPPASDNRKDRNDGACRRRPEDIHGGNPGTSPGQSRVAGRHIPGSGQCPSGGKPARTRTAFRTAPRRPEQRSFQIIQG